MNALQRSPWWYWSAQLIAWTIYAVFIVVWNQQNNTWEAGHGKVVVSIWGIGIAVSHLFRYIIIRRDWLRASIGQLLPRLLVGAVLLGLLAFGLQLLVNDLLFTEIRPLRSYDTIDLASMVLNWCMLLLLWSLAYFGYHYFVQSKRQEIHNLRMLTSMKEIELSNLRSQLNPHFMFNAMNSIRALIDEDPAQAKKAVTQMSNILRNSLTSDRKKLVPLEEELELVNSYLGLERIRYEERLQVKARIDANADIALVPPMMVQTLVENAVKHGISNLQEGGLLELSIERSGEQLAVQVSNSGMYRPGVTNGTGIGLRNTRKRLRLLFGDKADLTIENKDGRVVTRVVLPYLSSHESVDH